MEDDVSFATQGEEGGEDQEVRELRSSPAGVVLIART